MGNTRIKYVAEISPVREVWLVGAAELAFWGERLRRERLLPVEFDGQARVLISAIEARYMGVRFRELCISVSVRDADGRAGSEPFYLAQGFHSSRLFAWVERTRFLTPYVHGKIGLNASVPASIRLVEGDQDVFRAGMSPAGSGRALVGSGEESWEGAIFLPTRGSDSGPGKVFYAKMTGMMQRYAFADGDVLAVQRGAKRSALGWLIDSSFTGREWAVREDGTHARSKTFERK